MDFCGFSWHSIIIRPGRGVAGHVVRSGWGILIFVRMAKLNIVIAGSVAAAGLMCAAGCSTLSRTGRVDIVDPSIPSEPLLTGEQVAFSKALAAFAAGFSHEINREYAEALHQYQRASAYDPDRADLYVRRARIHLREFRAGDAEAVLRELIARQPANAQAYSWLAEVFRQSGQVDKAYEAYQQAIRLAPEESAHHLQYVHVLIQQGREDQAIEHLRQAIHTVNDRSDLLRVMGELHVRQAGLTADADSAQTHRNAAIEIFEQAVRENPDDITLLYSLGDLYLMSQQLLRAIEVYRSIDAKRPDDLQVQRKLAMSYMMAGQTDDAIAMLERIVKEQPYNAQVFMWLGELYESIEKRDQAMLNYQLATRAGRPDPAAYLQLARVQMEEDVDGAIHSLREGLEEMPANPRLNEMLGYLYFNKKQYDQALVHFARTLDILTEEDGVITANLHLYTALARQLTGDMDGAAPELGKAIRSNPDALQAYAHILFQDAEVSTRTQGIELLHRVAENLTDEPSVYSYIAYLHSFNKDYADAIAAFEQAEALAQRVDREDALDASFFFWYGAACEREQQYERAEHLFHECIKLDPDHAEAFNYLAYMWAEQGVKLDQALDYVRIALKHKPDSGAFIDTLGWIYYMQGRYDDAYHEIQRAAELVPDDPTILDHLGDILLKLGEEDAAVTSWGRSFRMDPENRDVAAKLIEHGIDPENLRDAPEAEDVESDLVTDETTPAVTDDEPDGIEPASPLKPISDPDVSELPVAL